MTKKKAGSDSETETRSFLSIRMKHFQHSPERTFLLGTLTCTDLDSMSPETELSKRPVSLSYMTFVFRCAAPSGLHCLRFPHTPASHYQKIAGIHGHRI